MRTMETHNAVPTKLCKRGKVEDNADARKEGQSWRPPRIQCRLAKNDSLEPHGHGPHAVCGGICKCADVALQVATFAHERNPQCYAAEWHKEHIDRPQASAGHV